ncbi:hypothetical protein A4G16_00315 [Mannheimia granulomatis]|uniref:ACP-like domain-containing protein n=1 Tax=Mannheimia granulomatis TaxID=85402 RepID=A0A6G8JFE4_9PAST|nr:hypothetical protein [Mannheimia granulomatis]QIM65932.1 hypothetical protein A4G16_00315 [Mannheimia granulomatis]
MKLVKFVPALAATLVLAACSNAGNQQPAQPKENPVAQAAEKAAQQVNDIAGTAHGTGAVKVEKATDGAKSIVYRCQNGKQVSATYAFQGEEAKAVNLVLTNGKKSQKIETLTRDTASQDFPVFKSDKYNWSLESGFSLSSNNQSGMLVKYGDKTDKILAKLCNVNKGLTSKLNK